MSINSFVNSRGATAKDKGVRIPGDRRGNRFPFLVDTRRDVDECSNERIWGRGRPGHGRAEESEEWSAFRTWNLPRKAVEDQELG